MVRKNLKSVRRRTVLETLGAGIAATSFASITGASDENNNFKDTIESSLEYRNDLNGTVSDHTEALDDWKDYLQDQGIASSHETRSDQIPIEENGNEFSTADYIKNELDITMSIARSSGNTYYVDLAWQYDDSHSMAKGSDPLDSVGMAYERDWWDWGYGTVSETTQTSTYVETNTTDGYDGRGPAYFMDDYQAWRDGSAGFRHYAGMFLEPAGPDANDRRVYGAYIHRSGGSNNYNVNVGLAYGVIAISGGSSGSLSWKTRFEDDENTPLRVHEDDVIVS